MFRGEVAALAAAGLWAFATLLFGRLGKRLSPLVLNLVKGGVAIALIVVTLLLRQQLLIRLPSQAALLLLVSGVVGIGLGDTAYFGTVNDLGPRRALLMETLAPPLSALMAWGLIGERLSSAAWIGIGVTLLGVAWVVGERAAVGEIQNLRRGILLGILAAAGQATGAVLSRAALADTGIDPLWSALLRLFAGLLCLGLILLGRPAWGRGMGHLRSGRLLAGVAVAAFFGTYLAIWLQQTAFKFAETGIAQALLATSPVFVLPMAAAIGERITGRAIVGALVASGGVCLLFLG
ncbi:MAG: DMT family transporter [Cyanobacteria bacterium J06632_22]